MNPLLYRRQFLLSPKPLPRLKAWQQADAGTYTLQVHPDCPLTRATSGNRTAMLVGYCLEPRVPKATNSDLAARMARSETLEGMAICLHGLSGRFLVFLSEPGLLRIYPDACGLRSLFWTIRDRRFHAASQPTLLGKAVPITPSAAYEQYFGSEYVKIKPGHYHPAGVSLYENVYQLVPNHFLEIKTGRSTRNISRNPAGHQSGTLTEQKPQPASHPQKKMADRVRHIRFYPTRTLSRISSEEGVDAFNALLKGSLEAAARRSSLALGLSAGLDSRLLLAATGPKVYTYTLINRDPGLMYHDIHIPKALAARLGFRHQCIDTRKPLEPTFRAFYNANTDIPHSEHWGTQAQAMKELFSNGLLAVKGDGAEIIRRYYYKYKRHPRITSHHHFVKMITGWKGIPFIDNAMLRWYEGVRPAADRTGHHVLDLFYWEHEMGGWMARNQLEWDICQEVFNPYSNRELLEVGLGVDERLRRLPDNTFFIRAIEKLWPELLLDPIHPQKTQSRHIRKRFKKLLMKVGLRRSKNTGRI